MRLQHPIPSGTRVAVYSRFSTDEQRRQSIDDQNDYCLSFLNEEYSKCLKSVEYYHDEGVSGELESRPGIDRLRQRIAQKAINLITSEDSSRLFRSVGKCENFVAYAVDSGVRVICINDSVDTFWTTGRTDWRMPSVITARTTTSPDSASIALTRGCGKWEQRSVPVSRDTAA